MSAEGFGGWEISCHVGAAHEVREGSTVRAQASAK